MIEIDLRGKKGLVIGIANQHSIAYGCARAFRQAGAELAITYVDERARPYTESLAEELGAALYLPLDVRDDGQMQALFERINEVWGALDFVLHSIAYCRKEDLHGRVIDASREGFLEAVDVSCYSFIEVARRAEPLLRDGGTLLTVSFYGAQMVVEHYNVMGPIKAALEAVTRYMAKELGPRKIRVHALSPGPLKTRAASGIAHFDAMLDTAAAKAPTHELVTIDDIGLYAAFLVSDLARNVTGTAPFIDGGYHIID